MAKNKVLSSKKPLKTITELAGLSENQASDEDMDRQEDTQRDINSRPNAFLAQRKAAYAEARKNAKDVVQAGITTLDGIRAQLEDLRGQELGLQKHREDCSLPLLTPKNILQDMDELYTHLLKDLGSRRSGQVNEANRMLRYNETCRQEALEKSSRRARHQLELTRQMEKDAVDAKELINHTKNLLRTNTGRKTYGRRVD